MTVKELYKKLDAAIPRELSCEWDNDGLMCCPDGDREVKRVLITLDVTADAVRRAIEGGYDVIISHHPLIFKGLKSLNDESFISEKAIRLIRHGISVFSFHTRLDALKGGVNDCLASLLGLNDAVPFGECDIGRIGDLEEPLSGEELASKVRDALGAQGVLLSDAGRPCKRIAVLGGEGGDDLTAARMMGADAYVSGRLGYHTMTDAPDMGITLIEAGHFYTEYPVCTRLAKMIRGTDKDIEYDLFDSNRIKLI